MGQKIRIPFMECNTIFLLAFHYRVLEGDMAIFITKTAACKLPAMLLVSFTESRSKTSFSSYAF